MLYQLAHCDGLNKIYPSQPWVFKPLVVPSLWCYFKRLRRRHLFGGSAALVLEEVRHWGVGFKCLKSFPSSSCWLPLLVFVVVDVSSQLPAPDVILCLLSWLYTMMDSFPSGINLSSISQH